MQLARYSIFGSGLCLIGLALGLAVGCSDKNPARMTSNKPLVIRNVPSPLRGTIGAEASIRGADPVLVSGFGLVSHLNGTGGGEINNVQLQTAMERELALGGIGRGGPLDDGPMRGMTPRQVLRDPHFAVVIVEASIPPGSPANSSFDVQVRALPGSSVNSLEGGILWTTDLRIGPATLYGQTRTRRIAQARGPIFINPFAEPGRIGADAVSRTVGRILDGGVVTEPLKLELSLDNESHSRARAITAAINSRFPDGPGDSGPIAQGRNASSIALEVPALYHDSPGEFLQLLTHLRIDQLYLNETAKRTVEDLKKQPEFADDIAWCLYALGKPALPFLSETYEYSEFAPRWAALFAGAKLGDQRTVAPLTEVAFRGPAAFRSPAIELLGDLPPNPRVNMSLRRLLDAPDLGTRVAAYEALSKRGDPIIRITPAGPDKNRPKFYLERVPATEPLIYVTQQGTPRLVIFGPASSGSEAPSADRLVKPMLLSLWSDRLMLAAEDAQTPLRLRFMDERANRASVYNPPEDLEGFIEFLSHRTTPEDPAPGLDLSYSEVVGAIYEIHRQGALAGSFATENDRLMADLYKAARNVVVEDRPETGSGAEAGPEVSTAAVESALVFEPLEPSPQMMPAEAPEAPGTRTWVVPLNTTAPDGKEKSKSSRD